MECSKCGRKLSILRFRSQGWWCKKCKMYVCRKCIDKKFRCPHCKKKIPTKLLIAAMMPAVIVFLTTTVMLAFYLPESIEEYNWNEMEVTDIGDLEAGDEVKIYGIINSTNPEPISGYDYKSDDEWEFKSTAENFYVYDETGQIYVNMSDWEVIYRGRHFASNTTRVGGPAYINNESVCIIGETELNETNELVLKGKIVGRNPKTFFDINDLSFFIYFSGISGFFLLIGATFFVYRISHHNRNKQSVQIAPPEDTMEHEPEFIEIEWYLNRVYNRFKLIAAFLTSVAVILTIVFIYLGWIPLEISSACCDFGVVLVFIYMWPPLFIWIYLDIPHKIGISQEGIHVRFRTKQFDQDGAGFIKWSDIREISSDIGYDTSLVFTMKDDEKRGIGSLSNEIGQKILDHYRSLRGETPKKIKPVARGKKTWILNQYTRKHIFYGKLIIIISILLIPVVIMISIIYNFEIDLLLYSFMCLLLPLFFGVMEIHFSKTAPEGIIFTQDGMHLKYFRKPDPGKPDYISWAEIDLINPPTPFMITMLRKNGIEQEFRFINIELIQTIIKNFEKYKIRVKKLKPSKLPPEGIEINWIENEATHTKPQLRQD